MPHKNNNSEELANRQQLIEGNDSFLFNEFFTLDGRVGYFYDTVSRPNYFSAIDLFHERVIKIRLPIEFDQRHDSRSVQFHILNNSHLIFIKNYSTNFHFYLLKIDHNQGECQVLNERKGKTQSAIKCLVNLSRPMKFLFHSFVEFDGNEGIGALLDVDEYELWMDKRYLLRHRMHQIYGLSSYNKPFFAKYDQNELIYLNVQEGRVVFHRLDFLAKINSRKVERHEIGFGLKINCNTGNSFDVMEELFKDRETPHPYTWSQNRLFIFLNNSDQFSAFITLDLVTEKWSQINYDSSETIQRLFINPLDHSMTYVIQRDLVGKTDEDRKRRDKYAVKRAALRHPDTLLHLTWLTIRSHDTEKNRFIDKSLFKMPLSCELHCLFY